MTRQARALICGALSLLLLSSAARAQDLEWEDLPPIPDAMGFGGGFAGVHDSMLLFAGGANFPGGPPWEGGAKVWYDTVWSLTEDADTWLQIGHLPVPLAYGVTIETERGLLLLGGSGDRDGSQQFDKSWYVRPALDGASLEIEAGPDLPFRAAFHSAARIADTVYVAFREGFQALSLESGSWRALTPYPGPPRIKTMLCAQADGLGKVQLYLFGGESQAGEELVYHRDCYRYAPLEDVWTPIAQLPETPLAAAPALPVGPHHIAIFSGATGEFVKRPVQERPLFKRGILAYHTVTDRWSEAGEMPLGIVTTSAVRWGDQYIIPSGEIRPGVRTPRVQRARLGSPQAAFGGLNWLSLGLYLSVIVLIGVLCARRNQNAEDYFLGGRRVPWWAAGLSIYATQLSAITYLSTPAVAFASDWAVAPGALMILAMAPLVIVFYLPFFRRLNVTTAYEYLERRFNLSVRLFGSASFVFYQLARMAIVVYLPALGLSAITGIEVHVCILLMGLLATLYTVLGGIEAVIWTDVVQVVVLLGGLFVCLFLIATDQGGMGEVLSRASEAGKLRVVHGGFSTGELATWSILLGSFLLQFGPYTTDQAVVQRYLTTESEAGAARALWLNGLMAVPFALAFFLLGSALWVYFSTMAPGATGDVPLGMRNDEVLPLFIISRLPAGVAGLVIAGVFAASMSSLDSSMHSVATAITTDFWRRFRPQAEDARVLRVARRWTVAAGAFGTALALTLASFDITSLFFLFQKVIGLFSSGLVAIFMLGMFTRRAHGPGVLIGALVATAVLAWATYFSSLHFYLYPVVGIGTALIVGYLASLLLPGHRPDLEGLVWRRKSSVS